MEKFKFDNSFGVIHKLRNTNNAKIGILLTYYIKSEHKYLSPPSHVALHNLWTNP